MASRFQASVLVASPSYPNSIAWSDENLIAVACGHLVTILNPALPFGPRGLIKVPSNEPFPIGVIQKEELLSSCLLPTCLSRDRDPCVRSVSWSPLGMAPNAGCLLAICTTEGRVKIYRAPFCDYSAEWIAIMDVSDLLHDYLANANYQVSEIPSTEFSDKFVTEQRRANNPANLGHKMELKRKRLHKSGMMIPCSNKNSKTSREKSSSPTNSNDIVLASDMNPEQEQGSPRPQEFPPVNVNENESFQKVSKSHGRSTKKKIESFTLPLISADQYASRSAMLSSLVIAWSPLLQFPSESCSQVQNSATCFSLLAIGGKSGKISCWKVHAQECYSIEHGNVSPDAMVVGIFQAHSSWVTTIGWALLTTNSSHPQVLLSTGSSNGSVKIWLAHSSELLKSSEVNSSPFILLKEIINPDSIPVSVLSLTTPVRSPHRQLLAVGKGSGSFEVWIHEQHNCNFERIGSYEAHDHAVTGLAWAFDGCCLYSCSEDNFVRSWMFHRNTLFEVPIPSAIPSQRGSIDVPNVFHSCFGVVASPGNLVMAMVRSFDSHVLNPMYQARSQKAAVEFLWMVGQRSDISSSEKFNCEAFSGVSKEELAWWKSNILWSLRQYERYVKPLVMWDIIAALIAINQSAPHFVDDLLIEWLSSSFMESCSKLSRETDLADFARRLSKLPSRHLHLLNVICRRVILSEVKADDINSNEHDHGTTCENQEEQVLFWMDLLSTSERELRVRLVGINFACSSLISHIGANMTPSGYWHPSGLAQMEHWAGRGQVRDQLRLLASQDGKRLDSCEHVKEEQCPYCSASVPFESPEVAYCQGANSNGNVGQRHKLVRCAVSMQICPTTPLWFCICCHRRASKLAPEPLFTMVECPENFSSLVGSSLRVASKPFCPFCGILLQRHQPEFLLSTVPV
ncbi:uncharacterized protein LOC115683051 isoform X2 [Syzygium oleosum]|uniref:uncharacterized protein LOC115683051 isoform X2 n=1 Tax=Syzygium oleosum TaxID=219896 RepID=UPI0011D28A15|nr:uncharacterized protein LOC115683051 isoform X2 [Syzygium oleosum]